MPKTKAGKQESDSDRTYQVRKDRSGKKLINFWIDESELDEFTNFGNKISHSDKTGKEPKLAKLIRDAIRFYRINYDKVTHFPTEQETKLESEIASMRETLTTLTHNLQSVKDTPISVKDDLLSLGETLVAIMQASHASMDSEALGKQLGKESWQVWAALDGYSQKNPNTIEYGEDKKWKLIKN